MLQSLQIKNYALIRSLDITFDRGFTVITGETGAGKSILLGALSLLLGKRVETDVLYDKAQKCIVEGTFDIALYGLQDFFTMHDLDYQDLTVIRREINEKGKSRAFVNDTPVNLAVLKELASGLIDIHSQHQNLFLQDSAFRLQLLDRFARNEAVLSAYRDSFALLKKTAREYDSLKARHSEATLQQEFNNYTIQELEKASLQPGEQEEAEKAVYMLNHAEQIKTHLYKAAMQLSEQDGETVLAQLKAIQNECEPLKEIGPEYVDLCNRLNSAILELTDISYDIARKEQDVTVDPAELNRLNERLDLIYSLEHKYQVETVADLLAIAERLKKESEAYVDGGAQLEALKAERQRLQDQTAQSAAKLTESRRQAIPQLESEIMQQLSQLSLPGSRFEIKMEQAGDFQENGTDSVVFLFSANKGIPLSDLGKVASGGEMSRVMLALKSVISDSVLLPTVIFDEIDTGISGETANTVAAAMDRLARQHQVIAITHLPQIAAKGTRQYCVFKEEHDGIVATGLKVLSEAERVKAIAALIGGSQAAEATANAARELLYGNKAANNQTPS